MNPIVVCGMTFQNPLFGMAVIKDPELLISDTVQFRFPRSKKARIRKKWAKRPENWKRVERDHVFKIGNTIVCSPSIVAQMRQHVQDKIEAEIVGAMSTPNNRIYG